MCPKFESEFNVEMYGAIGIHMLKLLPRLLVFPPMLPCAGWIIIFDLIGK